MRILFLGDVMGRSGRAAVAERLPHDLSRLLRNARRGQVHVGIELAHLVEEGRPIETLWDAATAVTAYARGVNYQDERVALERAAGKIKPLPLSAMAKRYASGELAVKAS